MIEILFRTAVTGFVIAGVSLFARRDPVLAGWISVFPTATTLALIWLAIDRTPTGRMADFTGGVVAGLLPSVAILIAFAVLLRRGIPFAISAITAFALWVALSFLVRHFGLLQT